MKHQLAYRHFLLSFTLGLAVSAFAAVKPPEALHLDGIPPLSIDTVESLSEYDNTRSARVVGWAGDNGLIIQTRFGSTVQLHWVKEPLGSRYQLTFKDEPVRFASAGPTVGHGIVYGIDKGGAESYQLYHLDPLTSTSKSLMGAGKRNTDPVFSRDGHRIAYSATAANGRDTHIYLMDLSTGTSRPILERPGTWYPLDFSVDDSSILLANYASIANIKLYISEIENRRVTRLDTDTVPASQTLAKFSPEDNGIWYLSNLNTDKRTLRFRNFEDGKVTDITDGYIPYDIENFEIANNGSYIAFVANHDGYDRLHIYDVRRKREVGIPEALSEISTRIYGFAFANDNNRLAISLASPSLPGDIFVLDIRRKRLKRWTMSELGELSFRDLTHPELIEFATFDIDRTTGNRRLIPAFYYKAPENFIGARPVIINIHGGPESQSRPTFNSLRHYLINELGVAVIYPNVRGSSGYGKEYMGLDDVFKREDAVKDIGALLDWISTRPELDHNKVAVMGGSYGGYMVLASMIRYPEQIRAGVNVVGISNFITFLETTQEYRRHLRREEYGDERKPQVRAFLGRISPLRLAQRIDDPLLIVQGANDPRVPVSESEQLLNLLRKNNAEAWYLLAHNEGHGFRRKENRDFYQAVVIDFMRKHLLGSNVDLPQGDPGL